MSNMPRGTFMQVMEKYTKSLKAFISAQGFGHYSKPNGGIPKTDLDQSVQTSLGKADTALQTFTESDPTVPAWAKASSKPSYTASEVGLGNVGNFKAVSTVASQGLSDTEKANARTNIGAGTGNGTYSKPSGGIPKTDLASAVQTSLGKADSALQSETDPTVPAWAKASTKPSYTASEVGLGNVGNFKAVSTVASQGLSDTEKANARANIGAGTSSFSGSYNDLSNKPTIPTKTSQLTNDSGYTANTGTVTGVKVGSTSYSPSSGVVSLPAYPTTLPASDVSSWAKASSKPSYTASEVGLGNVGNFKAVSTVASQGLSDTEKSNARTNIGAGTGNGTYSKPSDGIPKTDLASAVQTSLGKADSALQSHQTIKQDGITGATVNRFGTCSTAAATAAKTVSVTSGTFSLEAGARVTVKFTNANTAGTPTLNVNSKGAKNIFSRGSQITTGSNKSLLAGTVDFIYDGTQWHLIGNYIDTDTNTYPSAYCISDSGDAAKQANCTGYELLPKSYLHIIMRNANTSASALTLNVNSRGIKPIYINGSASSASNYTLPAGSYLVYYDGTNYYFRTDGNLATSNMIEFNETGYNLSSLLYPYPVFLQKIRSGDSLYHTTYKINHMVFISCSLKLGSEITANKETEVIVSYSTASGRTTNILNVGFVGSTNYVSGVTCYIKDGTDTIRIRSATASIPSGATLYITGIYLTESSYPPLPPPV